LITKENVKGKVKKIQGSFFKKKNIEGEIKKKTKKLKVYYCEYLKLVIMVMR